MTKHISPLHMAFLALGFVSAPSHAAITLYDNLTGFTSNGTGLTPNSNGTYYGTYVGYAPAQEFMAAATGQVTQIGMEMNNGGADENLTLSLWSINADSSFNAVLGSWDFTAAHAANPYQLTLSTAGNTLLQQGVTYGFELSTSGISPSSAGILVNSGNPNQVNAYAYCNLPFYCNTPSVNPQNPLAPIDTGLAGYGGQQYTAAISIAGVSAVPVPAAAWLFGSGLLGLIGIARRKAA